MTWADSIIVHITWLTFWLAPFKCCSLLSSSFCFSVPVVSWALQLWFWSYQFKVFDFKIPKSKSNFYYKRPFLLAVMSKLFSKLGQKIASSTDERMRTMNEIIVGMKAIKLYAWEKSFEKLIQTCRRYYQNPILK